MRGRQREREGDQDKDRDRQRDRETNRQIDRQTQTEIEKEIADRARVVCQDTKINRQRKGSYFNKIFFTIDQMI